MPDNNGELIDIGGRQAVRFTRRYPVPREDVWEALTDPDRLARWAFPAEFEPRKGGTVRFDYGEAGSAEGTILEWDEPSVLEYEWATDTDSPWRVRYELVADGHHATLMIFDHLLPDPKKPEFAAGWHWHFDRLATHLAGGQPAAVQTDEQFDRLLNDYQSELNS